ncbi:fungal-specific transcription factor domain-containing protein [Daldinia grandis]|nr:fungal-specific transcription factor domain-containing protein [Daldinia grandis]
MPSSNSSKSSQSPPSATRTPRTRTGCWACRDRSVKCDEARPRCRRCQKTNLTCHYGIRLQWLEDSVARGIRHGRQGVWRPKQKDATRDACTPTALLEGRFQESPGSAKYRARSKGVVYFLNTFSRDIQLYWNSQGFRDVLTDIALLEDDHAEEEDSIDRLLAGQVGLEERHKPHLTQYCGGSRTFPWKLATPVGRSITFTHQLARSDEFIPRYYTEVVCANASLVDGRHHNPFRYHIVPMASHSSTVFSAMLAVSAVKMAAKDPKFHRRALVHRHRVLVDVKRLLESDHIDTAKCLEALVSVVMLCWYDISDNCKSTWISHLVGIFGLLDVCLEQNIRSADYEGILHFGQQYLMYHLIMAKSTLHVDDVIPSYKHILSKLLGSPVATRKGHNNANYAGVEGAHNVALRTVPSSYGNGDFTAQPGFRLVGPSFNDELDKIDTHQGFSNRLLLIINDICDLRDAQNSDESNHQDADMEALERRVIEIQSKLDTLTQVPPGNIHQVLEAGMDRDARVEPEELRRKLEFITMTADSNRLAALLFLDETCATHLPHIVPQCRKSRSATIQKILSYVKNICETGPITAALPIWPVFVAGCMASTDDNRLQVMEIFDKFLSQKKFGSLPPALTVIQMVWRQRDLGCDENPRKILFVSSGDSVGSYDGKNRSPTSPMSRRQRTRYPWERAISMLGGSSLLSLT